MKKLFSLMLVLGLFLLGGCFQDEPEDAGGDDNTIKIYEHNDYMTLEKVEGYSEIFDRIKVEVNVINANDMEGKEIAIVGQWLKDINGWEGDWNNTPESRDFISTVTGGEASFVFYFDTGFDNTDFKIFNNGTWDEVITDTTVDDGNIRVDIETNGIVDAVAGDYVILTIDLGNGDEQEHSDPEIIYEHNKYISIKKLEEVSELADRIKIELQLKNIADMDGQELAIVGHQIYDSNNEDFSWNNVPGKEGLVATVSDGIAVFTFYYNTENETTDFKIFVNNTWDEVITDTTTDDGNIRINIEENGVVDAESGEAVLLTIDASMM